MSDKIKQIHSGKRLLLHKQGLDNRNKYINVDNNLFYENLLENRKCPVCFVKNQKNLFNKWGGTYVQCNSCNMIYLNPVFKDIELSNYYETNVAEQGEVVSDDVLFYEKIYTSGLSMVATEVKKGANLLDIGCSSGVFLDIAKSKGWNTYGIELNNIEYSVVKKKDHKVYNKNIIEVEFPEQFDLITLWDVFEHIKDGYNYIKYIQGLLTKDGVIFLQIPSIDSIAARIMREKCNMFDGLEHVNLYGIESLTKLVEASGMKILNIKSVISELSVLNNYLNYSDPYKKECNDCCYDFSSIIPEDKILDILQGYKLQVVIGRKSV
jgi:2-polyprenyl-3-methyl-5-hydroxy-6-metoxy-1,4-benzoquinol methylase